MKGKVVIMTDAYTLSGRDGITDHSFKDTLMLKKLNRKYFILTVFICLVLLTFIFASISRDRDSSKFTIVVKNGTSLYNIANMLKKEGIIYSSNLFVFTSLMYAGKLIAGEYELRKDMSTLEIVRKMGRSERNLYVLQIVEGYNIYDVADRIEKNNIMEKNEFLHLAGDKKYLQSMGITSDSLEGYLSPDTYYYSKEIETEKFIEKIVQRTLKYFERDDVKKQMAVLKLDTHKTLTLASMIEKEAKMGNEKPLVSAVFHNRLLKDMPFDSDPTVIYGTRAFHSSITKTDLKTHTPYNTYAFKGFPRGPICNPDKNSIMAVLNPAPVDYLFFVAKNDGTHVFSKDMNQHNRNVGMYQRSKTVKK
jgi:UPF0755 protein